VIPLTATGVVLLVVVPLPSSPLYRVEHAFARLGRWRRLSRCYEGTETSAKAWLEVAAVAYIFALMRAEPV